MCNASDQKIDHHSVTDNDQTRCSGNGQGCTCSALQHQLTACTQELAAAEQKTQELQRKILLITADFENVKRRSFKDAESLRHQDKVKIFTELLTVLDNFDRALSAEMNTHDLEQGIALIRKDLTKLLNNYGVHEIDNYTHFDPAFHESLMQVPADDTHAAGDIVQVMQTGYVLNGALLRAAKVSVAV